MISSISVGSSGTSRGSAARGPMSLPLLEGLVHIPGTSDSTVNDALDRFQAGRRIAIWARRQHERSADAGGTALRHPARPPRRRRCRTKTESGKVSSIISSHHWLIQSLQSSSLPERQVACKILASGCWLTAHTQWLLMDLLVTLLEDPVLPTSCFVSLLALLQHLALEAKLDGCSPTSQRLAYMNHPRVGLRWLCSMLWSRASSSATAFNTPGYSEQLSPSSLTASRSLVHFIHRLTLSALDDYSVSKTREYIWSGRSSLPCQNGDFTPLACLVGTYHLWKQPLHHVRGMSETLSCLRHIIDPKTTPTITRAKRPPKRASVGKIRLITSLQVSSTPNGNEDNTASKSSPAPRPKRSSSGGATGMSSPLSIFSSGSTVEAETSTARPRRAPSRSGRDLFRSSQREERQSQRRSLPRESASSAVSRIYSVIYGENQGENQTAQGDQEDHNDDEEIFEEEHADTIDFHEDEDDSVLLEGVDCDEGQDVDADMSPVEEDHNNDVGDDEGDDKSETKRPPPDEEDIDSKDDEDEEIDSDEADEDEVDDEEEHDIVLHEEEDDDMVRLEDDFLDYNDDIEVEDPQGAGSALSQLASAAAPEASASLSMEQIEARKRVYAKACMEVLSTQHPMCRNRSNPFPFSLLSERTLIQSILLVVKSPKKPANAKIILRRAPTQEEFFRGNLSKNPISLNMLRKENQQQAEPTVKDLRQHIANDLQMGDSAELLELMVANKILDVDLKLRVVHQVVWKEHLMQNSTSVSPSALSSFLGGRGGARSFISTGSGLSMIFSTGLERSLGGASNGINSETPLSQLPPMIVTYRLTGVDGEATEDTVSTLVDPEAPSEASTPEEQEKLMEKEYGITRLVTHGRGVICLLRSVERSITETLRRIRRDQVGGSENYSRQQFKQSSPYPGLTLLTYCSKLPSNRKLLLQSWAPTILLRLLLDVLHALEGEGGPDKDVTTESNATAKTLQELIESLASDMLSSNGAMEKTEEVAGQQDASTLRLLLSAIETSSLSRPLRNVIAKLLPYLTYGHPSLSKELASEFARHVKFDMLGDIEKDQDNVILMQTFVHASISLPPNDVCNTLRVALVEGGFVERVAAFALEKIPSDPPSWSPWLWAKGQTIDQADLETRWAIYLARPGLKTSFDILVGLCKQHTPTQVFLSNIQVPNKDLSLVQCCHWLESTSDHSSARLSMNGLGLVAETLLDELMEGENADKDVIAKVKAERNKTRNRKKEIAMERRSKALHKMSSFGPLAGSPSLNASPKANENLGETVRGTAASLLAPVLGLFHNSQEQGTSRPAKRRRRDSPRSKANRPAWMAEIEDIKDETGLTCAVCQEGRTLQPSELLGLYAYVKKVTVPITQCGGRNSIDGTMLLTSLPSVLPDSLVDSPEMVAWYRTARAAKNELMDSSRSNLFSSVANSRRATYFTTTVSAGNPIHINCHAKARQADRSHPKAPKSEWEGASLRNSRVNCNVIMPLVSSRSSKVSLIAVDVALTDHQTAVSNLLGARPKSMLWNILHDVRFLLLRMAYGEPLNVDCGGGSLASNSQLVFYQLLMADMFEKDAEVDAPDTARHARALSSGFLAASGIVQADDFTRASHPSMLRAIADSATMACLTCIAFDNSKADLDDNNRSGSGDSGEASDSNERHPKRRWVLGKEYFLRGLLKCAGRRHSMGVTSSGCLSGRTAGAKRGRSTAFAEWDIVEEEDVLDMESASVISSSAERERSTRSRSLSASSKLTIEDFRDALRPMIVFYAMMDQLSSDFVLNMDDVQVEESANRLVQVMEGCHKAKTIQELLHKANITLDHDEIIEELQRGMP